MFENLIVVSYCGGSCGNAVSYVIGFSPEVKANFESDNHIVSLDKNGAIWPQTRPRRLDASGCHDIVSIHDRLGHRKYDRTKPLSIDVIEEYQRCYNTLTVNKGETLIDSLKSNRVVIADHAMPHHNAQVWPNAAIVAVNDDWKSSMRKFAQKFLYAPSEFDHCMTAIEYELVHSNNGNDVSDHKERLRMHANALIYTQKHNKIYPDAIHVDAAELFSDHGESAYLKLMHDLNLTPCWDEVHRWIDDYVAAQWQRF